MNIYRSYKALVLLAFSIALMLWFLEAVAELLLFHPEADLKSLLFPQDPHEQWMRMLIIVLSVPSAFYIHSSRKRKEIEEKLSVSENIYRKNFFLQKAIASVLDISLEKLPLKEQLGRILDSIISIPVFGGAGKGCIFIYDPVTKKLRLQTYRGMPASIQKSCASLELGQCLCGKAASGQETIFSENIDHRHTIIYDGIEPHSQYCLPISSGDKLLGVITFCFDQGRQRDKEEESFLLSITNALAGVLERRNAETALVNSSRLISSIKEAQGLFITGHDHARVFRVLLEALVAMTESEYGFLDEVLQDKNGKWYKRSLAISDIAWDKGSQKLYEELKKSNLEFHNLHNLAGEPVKTGSLVISDDPSHDSRSGGLPEGHPRLNSFMGIPMYFGGDLVGVAGVANRKGGYVEGTASFLEPFTSTCAGIIAAIRSENARKKLMDTIKEERSQLKDITSTLGEGVLVLNKECIITFVNPEACRLLGRPERELSGKVFHEMVHCYSPEGNKLLAEECLVIKTVTSGNTSHSMDEFFTKKDGSTFPVSLVSTPIVKDGKIYGSVTVFQDITDRKRVEEQIKKSLEEKELLLQEIHHRVKNNMTVVHSLLELQSEHIHDERDREMFRESMNRIKSMAMIHEKLYQSKDLARIKFAAYLKYMITNIFSSYGTTYDDVALTIDVEDVSLGIDAAIPCALIINELVSNSLKYAFPDNRKGEVMVALSANDKDEFELIVSDNGAGVPEDLNSRSAVSLGLNLVNALVNQLQGNITLNRDRGTEFKITFRKPDK